MKVVIITGLSGAGKSTALHALEDSGYFTMDNLLCKIAIFMMKNAKKGESDLNIDKLALGIDNRAISSPEDFGNLLSTLENEEIEYDVIFLEASTEVILNRYNLTRRRHPYGASTLLKSIEEERKAMKKIKEKSNFLIDTTNLSAKELSNKIKIISASNKKEEINIHIQSFGFKYGVPLDADMIFDVRTLPNPYYIEELRDKTGNDIEVSEYVMSFPESEELYSKILDMTKFLIPLYKKRYKTTFNNRNRLQWWTT